MKTCSSAANLPVQSGNPTIIRSSCKLTISPHPTTLLILLGLFKLNLLSTSIILFHCSMQCCCKQARLIKLHGRLCTDTFDRVTGVIHV